MEANINFSGSYKGFDLSFSLGGAFGHKLYNGNRYFYESMSAPGNMLSSVANAWTPQNTHTSVPRAIYNDPTVTPASLNDSWKTVVLYACVKRK